MNLSDERLYHEIKLLDPTFSMCKLYHDLLHWYRQISLCRRDGLYRLYEILCKYMIRTVSYDTDSMTITLHDSNALDLYRDIVPLQYDICIIDDTYTGVHISSPYLYNAGNRIYNIDRTMSLHPILNLKYKCSNLGGVYGYMASDHSHMATPYVCDISYDDNLYEAIRSIDPTITMYMLYNTYIHKHRMESAIHTVYTQWSHHLHNIDTLWVTGSEVCISCKNGTSLNSIIDEKSGWRYDIVDGIYSYSGDDVHIVYDQMLTMLRVYHSYATPCPQHIGTTYYPI